MDELPKQQHMPDGENKDGQRASILSSLKTYLQFFGLALLVTEGLLTYLAAHASEYNLRFIIIGIVGTLPLLVIVVAGLAALHKVDEAVSTKKPGTQPIEWISKLLVFSVGFGSVALLALTVVTGYFVYRNSELATKNVDLSVKAARSEERLGIVERNNSELSAVNTNLQARLGAVDIVQRTNILLNERLDTMRAALDAKEKEMTGLSIRLGQSEDRERKATITIGDLKLETNRLGHVELENTDLQNALKSGSSKYEDLRNLIAILQTNQHDFDARNEIIRDQRDELQKRFAPIEKAGFERFFERANDFHSDFLTLLHQARQELVFFGFNFYITAGEKRSDILEILRTGVSVKFLVYDPTSPELERAALDFGQPVDNLRGECLMGYEAFRNLITAWKAAKQADAHVGMLEIRYTKTIPRARVQFIDPSLPTGHTFIVPYVNRQNASNLPGFLFSNAGAAAPQYYLGIRQLWSEAEDIEKLSLTLAVPVQTNTSAVSQQFPLNSSSATDTNGVSYSSNAPPVAK